MACQSLFSGYNYITLIMITPIPLFCLYGSVLTNPQTVVFILNMANWHICQSLSLYMSPQWTVLLSQVTLSWHQPAAPGKSHKAKIKSQMCLEVHMCVIESTCSRGGGKKDNKLLYNILLEKSNWICYKRRWLFTYSFSRRNRCLYSARCESRL